jgi:hypothetical protein
MKINVFVIFSTIFLFISCSNSAGIRSRPPSDQLIWISYFHTGGKQCDAASYCPPDIKFVLDRSGIMVFEFKIEVLPVCEGCSCPQYAANYYALIDNDCLIKACNLGFTQNNPPGYLLHSN